MRSTPFPLRLTAIVAAAALGCGAEPPPPDAPASIDGRTVDAAQIDAAIDARPIDAPTDARPVDAPVDAPPVAMVNGCTAAGAVDRTAAGASRTVTFPGTSYSPRCMRVKVGQTVTWSGDFTFHPLRAGQIVGAMPMGQAGNPILATDNGNSRQITFNAIGEWGYYCNVHWPGGMTGAIYVVP